MKKTFELEGNSFPFVKKLIMEIKIAFLIIVVSISNLLATDTYSQTAKVTLDMENQTLEQVMDEIEKQSEFYFIFNQKQIDVRRVVGIQADNSLITEVLPELFEGTDVIFTVFDRKILLTVDDIKESLIKLAASEEFQQLVISGVVRDASTGEAMPGVNVLLKGTSVGAIADENGRYSIPVSDLSGTLVFTFIGYNQQEIQVNGQRSIDVLMSPTVEALQEVVVIGYGTVQKKDLTGSVTRVQAEELQNIPVARIDQALAGKTAGVQVMTLTSEPGESPMIRIRGVGSISAGSEPLYVVDGYPVDNIQMINPNDIESLDILKDASATAIYGSRGANGVIIISTKRGKAGDHRIGLDTYFGWQEVLKLPEFLTMEEQAWYYYYGVRNQNLDKGYDVSGDPTADWIYRLPQTIDDVLEGRNTVNSDAFDHIFQNGLIQSYNLSASGGTEAMRYSVSGEFFNQDGIVKTSNYKRYSLRINLDAQLSKRLAIKTNINTSYSTSRDFDGNGGQGGGEGVFGAAMTWQRWYPLFNDDGTYFSGYGQDATNNVWNPVAQIDLIKRWETQNRTLANINVVYEFTDALNLNVMVGANTSNYHFYHFVPIEPVFARSVADGEDERSEFLNWITETTLNYNKSFGDHNITGLLGYTTQKNHSEGNYLRSRDYPNNLVYTLNAASNIIYQGSSNESEWSLISYLSRFNYNYKNKYYVTFSLRADGSSRFGKDNKYGYFPSAAIAWRISDERFMSGMDFISDWKLRASYGETGNNNIGNYAHIATVNFESYPFGGSAVGGYAPSNFANSLLTWEKQRSLNFGTDLSLINGRISFSGEYFKTNNYDLLLNVYVPQITGFNTSLQNIGEVENKGWEISLNTRNFVNNFVWTTDFNISSFKNKVIKLGPEGAPIISSRHITQIGQPMGMFYGYKIDGVFQTQAELDAGPLYGTGTSAETRLGDIRFKDVSGPDGVPDGKITTADRTIIGNPYPDFYYGLTNTFSYKNFTLVVAAQGSVGNEVITTNDFLFYTRARYKQPAIHRDYWISEEQPGDNWSCRPNNSPTGGVRSASDRHVDSGTYFKINNLNLSYSFPAQIAGKLSLSSLKAYINVANALLITDYMLVNPEVSNSSNPLTPAVFAWNWPLARTFTLGLNVTF